MGFVLSFAYSFLIQPAYQWVVVRVVQGAVATLARASRGSQKRNEVVKNHLVLEVERMKIVPGKIRIRRRNLKSENLASEASQRTSRRRRSVASPQVEKGRRKIRNRETAQSRKRRRKIARIPTTKRKRIEITPTIRRRQRRKIETTPTTRRRSATGLSVRSEMINPKRENASRLSTKLKRRNSNWRNSEKDSQNSQFSNSLDPILPPMKKILRQSINLKLFQLSRLHLLLLLSTLFQLSSRFHLLFSQSQRHLKSQQSSLKYFSNNNSLKQRYKIQSKLSNQQLQ